MDLLMALESQASSAGGRAIALLGNHEVMNLIGETRDVTPEIFATFADANSEKRREAAWEEYAKLAARVSKGEPVPAVYGQTREAWLTTHPPGYVEYRDAFAPRGKYGAWLRHKPIVLEANGSIFMHAGIAPETAPARLEDLNVKVQDELERIDRFADHLVKAKLATPMFTLQEAPAGRLERNRRGQQHHRGGEGQRQGAGPQQTECRFADGSPGAHEHRDLGGDRR